MKLSRENPQEKPEKRTWGYPEKDLSTDFAGNPRRILEGNLAEIERSFHAGPEL